MHDGSEQDQESYYSVWFGPDGEVAGRLVTAAAEEKGVQLTLPQAVRLHGQHPSAALWAAIERADITCHLNRRLVRRLGRATAIVDMADRYARMLEKWDAIEAEVSIAEAARISVGAVVLDLENAAYQFAKTMPQWPHWYTLRREWEGALSFGVVIAAIHRYGEDGVFQGTTRRYLHANGWKYWSMIDPHAGSVATILVNRARGDRRRRPHDRVPDWDTRLEPLARQYARSGQVLDVGCAGDGALIAAGKIPADRYTGISVAPPVIEATCRAHPPYATRTLHTRLTDLWPPYAFDLIWLHGGALRPAETRHAWSLLAPGGTLLAPNATESCVPGMTITTGSAGRVGIATKPLAPPDTHHSIT